MGNDLFEFCSDNTMIARLFKCSIILNVISIYVDEVKRKKKYFLSFVFSKNCHKTGKHYKTWTLRVSLVMCCHSKTIDKMEKSITFLEQKQ